MWRDYQRPAGKATPLRLIDPVDNQPNGDTIIPRTTQLPPVQHRFVDTGGGPIHVAELASDGQPLLLIHGIGMDWRVWQAISRQLWPHFHLYMIDLRGHGQSAKPEHGYTLPHYAADVEDLIDQLGLGDVVMTGSSLGGMVAAVVEAPEDIVARRVLVDPPLTGGPVRDPGQFEEILRLKHEPVDRLASYLARSNPGTGQLILRVMSEMWHEAADGVIADMLDRSADYFDVSSALRWIPSPTLLMRGDSERGAVLKPEWAQRALELLPQGEEVYVPGAGHAIHADQPAEFARILTDFASKAG